MNEDRPRILCVDDEPGNLILYEAMLRPQGFDVITAMSGAAALEIAGKERIDLVLLDVLMPGMDGFEVCRRLKNCHETASIPVVMITTLDDSESVSMGLSAGTRLFLTKPITGIDLAMRIRFFLGMPL